MGRLINKWDIGEYSVFNTGRTNQAIYKHVEYTMVMW